MNRIYLLLVLLLFAAPAFAQDEGGNEETEDVGIPVDFNEYLKSTDSRLDPGGRHDIFNLKNPTEPDERHEYVDAMTQIIRAYMRELEMGATIAKVFDRYSRGEHANQAVYKVLHAVVLRYYPPGQPNIAEMQSLLREAAEVENFAYPNYLLAQVEYDRFRQIPNTSPKSALELLNRALEARPKFLNAALLKSQIFMMAQPPKTEEVRKMIEPWTNGKLPDHPSDFENLMKMYAQSHTSADLHDKLNNLLKANRLSAKQRVRALQLLGSSQLASMDADAAIDAFSKSLEFIDPAEDPASAIRSERALAACKFGKLQLIQRDDPELSDPANQELFDELVAEIRKHHEICTQIEREHMPKTLRGSEARTYAIFLAQDLNKPEQAYTWLGEYLDGTELTSAQRKTLLNLYANLGILIDPTEENIIARYENFIAADDMVNLAKSFAIARAKVVQENTHFTLNRSLNLFISQIENRQRPIVMDAAFLAADTARQIGDEAIEKACTAIADRFEKETEISSDEQADLIEDLSRTLREFGNRRSQERVIRHLGKLIAETPQLTNMRMSQVLVIWTDDAFQGGLKNPPRKLGLFDKRKPDKVAEWLGKTADAVAEEVVYEGILIRVEVALRAINQEKIDHYQECLSAAAKKDSADLESRVTALAEAIENWKIKKLQLDAEDEKAATVDVELTVKDGEESATVALTVKVIQGDEKWMLPESLVKQIEGAIAKGE